MSEISASRTYMIGIYDPNSENEIRFEKVVLPEGAPNTIKSAKQHYLLNNIEEAEDIRIAVCISIEEYTGALHKFTEEEKEDIELTLKMLYDWNVKQKNQSESYSGALTALLKQVIVVNDFYEKLTKLKEEALALLQQIEQ